MSGLDEVGERDGWRCWICDEKVDPRTSVNDPRGPSIDSYFTASKSVKSGKSGTLKGGGERLAHRACNTKKGAVTPVIRWPDRLLVSDPAVLLTTVDRLERKGGREIVGRCPSQGDAEATATWLTDRLSRLAPGLQVASKVEAGGGQYLVALVADRAARR